MADPQTATEQSKGYGTASLVLGILSLIIPFVGFILAILAIVLALKQRKIQPTGVATAGLVLGIIGLVAGLLLGLLMMIGAMAYFGALSPDNFLPDKCSASPPFSCVEFSNAGDDITFVLQANAGADLSSTRLAFACDDGTPQESPDEPMADAAQRVFTFSCPAGVDGWQRGRFEIASVMSGEDVERISVGSVMIGPAQ